jgi:hypothetical protein
MPGIGAIVAAGGGFAVPPALGDAVLAGRGVAGIPGIGAIGGSAAEASRGYRAIRTARTRAERGISKGISRERWTYYLP